MASSVMHRFTVNVPREPKWFETCAEGYILSGRFNEICDHNAIIASNAGRNDVRYLCFFIYSFIKFLLITIILYCRLVLYGILQKLYMQILLDPS